MRQTAIGKTQVEVGAIAYGCWRFAESSVEDADTKIRTALDAGMSLIDTADIYGLGEPRGFGGAEAVLGDVLARDPALRSRMILATKGGITPPRPYDSSYDYLTKAMDASLSRLKTDSVDLYQIHRPDLTAPVEETARALNDMVGSGKARFIGVSNYTVPQTRALQAHLDAPLVSTQPEFSALRQDPIVDGTLDWCSETGATALAWSPLAGGDIPRLSSGHPRGADVIACLQKIAEAHSASVSNIALAFTLKHQAKIIPIIGTQNLARIMDSAKAAEINLSARDFYDIVEAYRGEAMP
jgi:aryl-alcohol dehydrogenase-like predicted oxidoreductase